METVYHPQYRQLVGVRAVKPLTGFHVRITFSDGTERDIDLEPYLHGPVFEAIRGDPQMFAAVHVDDEGDTIAWPNGADIAPETLYYDGDPPWAIDEANPAAGKPKERKTRRAPVRAATR